MARRASFGRTPIPLNALPLTSDLGTAYRPASPVFTRKAEARRFDPALTTSICRIGPALICADVAMAAALVVSLRAAAAACDHDATARVVHGA
jgi:hypothetical protein